MKLIGKLAIIAGSLAVSGISAAVVAVKNTETGAKAWASTKTFAVKQYDAVSGVSTTAASKIVAKYESVKENSEKSGEAKAVTAEIVKDEELYACMKQMLADRKAAATG